MKKILSVVVLCCIIFCTAAAAELIVEAPDTVSAGDFLEITAWDPNGGYNCISTFCIIDGVFTGEGASRYGTGQLTIKQIIHAKSGTVIDLLVVARADRDLHIDLPGKPLSDLQERFAGNATTIRKISVVAAGTEVSDVMPPISAVVPTTITTEMQMVSPESSIAAEPTTIMMMAEMPDAPAAATEIPTSTVISMPQMNETLPSEDWFAKFVSQLRVMLGLS